MYSNFDHKIDHEIATQLLNGTTYTTHPAWEFHGTIWYDADNRQYHEIVMSHHIIVAHRTSDSLEELIADVNNEYGHG